MDLGNTYFTVYVTKYMCFIIMVALPFDCMHFLSKMQYSKAVYYRESLCLCCQVKLRVIHVLLGLLAKAKLH
jgi:hypothetical protein